jgi:lipid-binding SYLF domain-containing protein
MKTTLRNLATTCAALSLALLASQSASAQSAPAPVAAPEEEARLVTATEVLEELRSTPDQSVPTWLFDRAYGVAVVPDVIKGAFFVGGRRGKGVLVSRDAQGRFSDPLFISLTGGSFGLQWGAQAADIVLVFATRRSLDNFARGQLTLGATASVAAGPVGRASEASGGVNAEIYSYSRARGLFAGIALDGTVLAVDRKGNRNFYGKDVSSGQVIGGQVHGNSEAARRLVATIVASLSATAASAAGQSGGTPATASPAAPAAAAPQAEGARSFPLSDPQPGAEPR